MHIYVYIDGHSPHYYPVKLPQKSSIEEWQDKANAWVKLTSPYAFQSNNAISETLSKIVDLHKRFCDAGKQLLHYHIAKELDYKGDRLSFNDYFKNYVKHPPNLVVLEESTWEKYTRFIQHLDKFNPRLHFDEIDVDMAARIRNYLTRQPGQKASHMGPASVKSLFDKFLVVLRHAAEEDKLIKRDQIEEICKKVSVNVPDREDGLHWDVIDIRNFKRIPTSALLPSQIRIRNYFCFRSMAVGITVTLYI